MCHDLEQRSPDDEKVRWNMASEGELSFPS